MLYIDITHQSLSGSAKAGDIRKYGLLQASLINKEEKDGKPGIS